MSGRRSSSAEGRPPAPAGASRGERRPTASVRSAGGCSGQHRDRVLELRAPDAEVDRLRLRASRAGSGPSRRPTRATMPALYWFWVIWSARWYCATVLVEQPLLRVERAELEVVGRELALAPTAAPTRGRRRSPARCDVALDAAPDPAPQVELPARLALEAEAVGDDDELPPPPLKSRWPTGCRRDVPTPCRCAPAVVDRSGNRPARASRTTACASRNAASACFRVWFEIVDLPLQPVQHRVAEDRPPRAAVDRRPAARRASSRPAP